MWAAAAAWRTIAEQNRTGPGGPRRGIRNVRGLCWELCCANACGFGHARVISALSGIWESGEYIRTGIYHWGGIAHNRRSAQIDQVPASRSWDRAQQAPPSYILNTGGRAVLAFWPNSGLIGRNCDDMLLCLGQIGEDVCYLGQIWVQKAEWESEAPICGCPLPSFAFTKWVFQVCRAAPGRRAAQGCPTQFGDCTGWGERVAPMCGCPLPADQHWAYIGQTAAPKGCPCLAAPLGCPGHSLSTGESVSCWGISKLHGRYLFLFKAYLVQQCASI